MGYHPIIVNKTVFYTRQRAGRCDTSDVWCLFDCRPYHPPTYRSGAGYCLLLNTHVHTMPVTRPVDHLPVTV